MICKICGNNMADDAKFCTGCGAKIEEEQTAPVIEENAASDEVSEPVSEEYTAPSEETVTYEETPTEEYSPVQEEFTPYEETEPEESAPVSLEKTVSEDVSALIEAEKSAVSTAEEEIPEPENITPVVENTATESDNQAEEMKASEIFAQEERMSVESTPKKLSAGRAAGASFVALFAVIFLIVFNLVFTARIGLSGDILGKSASSLKAEQILDGELDGDETVAEYIYDKLDEKLISKSGAEVKDMRSFLIEADVVGFFSETLEGYASYLINGKGDDPSISSEDIAEFIEDNNTLFYYEMGCAMSDKDYEKLEKSLADEGVDEALSIDEWGKEIGFSLSNAHFIFSFITIGVLFAIVLVFYIWTAIILDRHTKNIMGFFRTITLIGGLVLFIPTVLFLVAVPFAALNSGNAIVYMASKLLLPFAAVGACTGLFEIIVAVIFGKIRKLIKKRERKMNGGC
ncbi:MAG: hypothetical protein E7497_00745 [Ruminococcus sp.]|nr:hypothetical protein [Ruminococcus sp.]